jgi:glycerol kinase
MVAKGGSPVILAIDQGTTGSTVLLIDENGAVTGRGYREVPTYFPQPGWVEQDAEVLWQRTLEAVAEALSAAPNRPIAALGITNQRETTVLWDARTGKPVAPAIVWQCRRTASRCEELRARGLAPEIARRTGLVVDPYFSATKVEWLLNQDRERRRLAETGALRFGTVDSWLLWNLSGGQAHQTDYTNASRTMLFNIFDLAWDPHLTDLFAVPPSILPRVAPSSSIHAETVTVELPNGDTLPAGLPIASLAGDQQSALFGQACFVPGMAKVTYGTGAFVLLNNGATPARSSHGLLTTIACGPTSQPAYALEGSVFVAGAAIQWLRDQLGLIRSAAETDALARDASDNGGVYFVPAFNGLGAPYWDAEARGAIVGLTRGVGRPQLVRAALEAIAYQTRDVVEAMVADATSPVRELRVDGGAAANDFLAQFQADLLGAPVVRPRMTETTALGAAYLAGLAIKLWSSTDELAKLWRPERRFTPTMPTERRNGLYRGWQEAVARVRSSHGR